MDRLGWGETFANFQNTYRYQNFCRSKILVSGCHTSGSKKIPVESQNEDDCSLPGKNGFAMKWLVIQRFEERMGRRYVPRPGWLPEAFA